MFWEMVIYIIVIVIICQLLENYLRKKYKIKKEGFLYQYVNSVHKDGELTITLLFLFSFVYITYNGYIEVPENIIYYFIILFGFRAFMAWKYERASKKYILTMMTLGLMMIGIGLLPYLEFL
ncbi:DUF4181 domain-containing protein [Ornithinibacillus caprae]|nr:DUF4181 domain-containing protein [Ornithinibacillus caprae]